MQLTAPSRGPSETTSIHHWISGVEPARQIEVVIPFTNTQQVQIGLTYAEQLCAGLNAVARVVRVVIVPFPLDIDHPAISLSAAVQQMESLTCALPLTLDLRLSRDLVPALMCAMTEQPPLVLLTAKRRPWRTKEEKLARALKRGGCDVLLTYEANKNA